MSAPRYRIPAKLRSLLRERGSSVAVLGALTGMGFNRALYALSGHPKAKNFDRLALLPMLKPEEQRLLPVEHFQGREPALTTQT